MKGRSSARTRYISPPRFCFGRPGFSTSDRFFPARSSPRPVMRWSTRDPRDSMITAERSPQNWFCAGMTTFAPRSIASFHCSIHVGNVDENHYRRASIQRRRPARQSGHFGFDHQHLLTNRQQPVADSAVGAGSTIQHLRLEYFDAEVDLAARISADETRNYDRGIVGYSFDLRRAGADLILHNDLRRGNAAIRTARRLAPSCRVAQAERGTVCPE